jgi:uncharacterized protein (DUF1330 family)
LIVVLNLFDIIPGCEKRYAEYLRRVQPILGRHGAKILLYGLTRTVYLGQCQQQYCGLIGYPDMRALKALSADPEFREIRPLRDDSTTHYVLTAIEDFETLNHAAAYLENGSQQAASPGQAQPTSGPGPATTQEGINAT